MLGKYNTSVWDNVSNSELYYNINIIIKYEMFICSKKFNVIVSKFHYWLGTVTSNHLIACELLVLDRNTWNQ